MTIQEKELLLKDISARLSYVTIVSVNDGTIKYKAYIESVSYKNIQVSPVSDSNFTACTFYKISEIKPYLRPMSSMTEEEEIYYNTVYTRLKFYEKEDWLNAHHFDYRGLIEKGLAIEALEGMYEIKEK